MQAISLLLRMVCLIVSLAPQVGVASPIVVVEAFHMAPATIAVPPHRRTGRNISKSIHEHTYPQVPVSTALFSQYDPQKHRPTSSSANQAEAEALANLEQTRAALQRALDELDQIHRYQLAGIDAREIGEDGRSASNSSPSASCQAPPGSNMPTGTDTDARNPREIEVQRVRARQMEQLQRKAEAMQRKATAAGAGQGQSQQSQNNRQPNAMGQGVQQTEHANHPNNIYPYGGDDGRVQQQVPSSSQPEQPAQSQVMSGQAQYQENLSPERRFQTINAATSIPSNYNLNEAAQPPPQPPPMNVGGDQFGNQYLGFGGQQPPTARYGYDQQQQYYGQAPTPSRQFDGGHQQQQQHPSWAQTMAAPWSFTGGQDRRNAAAANESNPNQGTRQQGCSPLQASADTQRAAQSMRDETIDRPAGTVEERRAQKVREARSEFRNAASREKFAAGQYHKYSADYGMDRSGFEGGIFGCGGYHQMLPMQQPARYGVDSASGPFGGYMDSAFGMGNAPSFDRIPYNQRGYDNGGPPSHGDFGSQPHQLYGAAGGASWAGQPQDELWSMCEWLRNRGNMKKK